MSTKTPAVRRRILLALDPSSASLDAVVAAVELARHMGADLTALFVEDDNVLKVLRSPLSRQLLGHSGRIEAIEPRVLDAELGVLRENARAALKRAAESKAIPWSFIVARDSMRAALARELPQVDLLLLESMARPLVGQLRVRAVAKATLAELNRPTVLFPPHFGATGNLVVVYDLACEARLRAFKLAVELAGLYERPLEVLVLGDIHQAAAEIETSTPRPKTRLRVSELGSDATLAPVVQKTIDGVLVIPRLSALVDTRDELDQLAKAKTALVLVP